MFSLFWKLCKSQIKLSYQFKIKSIHYNTCRKAIVALRVDGCVQQPSASSFQYEYSSYFSLDVFRVMTRRICLTIKSLFG